MIRGWFVISSPPEPRRCFPVRSLLCIAYYTNPMCMLSVGVAGRRRRKNTPESLRGFWRGANDVPPARKAACDADFLMFFYSFLATFEFPFAYFYLSTPDDDDSARSRFSFFLFQPREGSATPPTVPSRVHVARLPSIGLTFH